MVLALAVVAGLLLTLWLPIYPSEISGPILAFGGLAGLTGVLGLHRDRARQVAVLMLPWAVALLVAFAVGAVDDADPRQALEDALPFGLFVCGLVAARGANDPKRLLAAALLVCVADAAVSLWKMPYIAPGIRSTYFYFKITAGLPLVGLFIVAVLRADKPRVVLTVASGLLWLALLASVSRGMILAACLGVAVVAYFRRPNLLVAASVVGIALGLVYSGALLDLGMRYLRFDQASTVHGRLREVHLAFEAFGDHPWQGAGLGAQLEVDGRSVSFVHNLIAYHLWKFGLVGCALLTLPIVGLSLHLRHASRRVRAASWGVVLAVLAYLTTSAAFKTYYLVWIYGVVVGATFDWIDLQWMIRRRPQRKVPAASRAANDRGYRRAVEAS